MNQLEPPSLMVHQVELLQCVMSKKSLPLAMEDIKASCCIVDACLEQLAASTGCVCRLHVTNETDLASLTVSMLAPESALANAMSELRKNKGKRVISETSQHRRMLLHIYNIASCSTGNL